MFGFFRKIWHALFSWNTRFEILPFALLPTKNDKWSNVNEWTRILITMEAVSQSHCKTHRVIACKFTRKELCDKGFPKNFTNQGKKHIWVTSSMTKTEKNRRCFSLNITSILFHLLTIFKVSRNFKILNSGTAFYKNLFFLFASGLHVITWHLKLKCLKFLRQIHFQTVKVKKLRFKLIYQKGLQLAANTTFFD